MPLDKGKSKKAFKRNVKEMVASGKPANQSVAAAYAVKRKPKKKK